MCFPKMPKMKVPDIPEPPERETYARYTPGPSKWMPMAMRYGARSPGPTGSAAPVLTSPTQRREG